VADDTAQMKEKHFSQKDSKEKAVCTLPPRNTASLLIATKDGNKDQNRRPFRGLLRAGHRPGTWHRRSSAVEKKGVKKVRFGATPVNKGKIDLQKEGGLLTKKGTKRVLPRRGNEGATNGN